MRRFYNQQHRFYCGVDLHARTLSLCVLDTAGTIVLQQTVPAGPDAFLRTVAPFRDDLAVACECMFAWYWLADLCHDQGIPFVLGHALYMKAIHGGKAKTELVIDGDYAYEYYGYDDDNHADSTPRPAKPTKLAIEVPKQIKVGAATSVKIKTPYKGKVLWTIETDKVITSAWRDTSGGEASWTFTMPTFGR